MKHLAPLALSLALLAPIAAHAASSDEVYATRVSHADLDLGQARDANVMLARLDRAALSACGASTFSIGQVKDEVRGSTCYRQSMDRAVAALAAPTVNAAYHARSQQLAVN